MFRYFGLSKLYNKISHGLRGCFQSIRRLKPLLHKQNPPARVINLLVHGGGLCCVCSSAFNRRVKLPYLQSKITMKSTDIIILQAFLNALSQFDKPLPMEIQNQLNQFGESLSANSTNIGELDTIAKSYEPLNVVYQTELNSLVTTGAEKNKGIENLPPKETINQKTPEIINTARDVFTDKDSVGAVKKMKQSQNILRRIFNLLFTGNK